MDTTENIFISTGTQIQGELVAGSSWSSAGLSLPIPDRVCPGHQILKSVNDLAYVPAWSPPSPKALYSASHPHQYH